MAAARLQLVYVVLIEAVHGRNLVVECRNAVELQSNRR